ncbi:MAG: aminopeptidase P family N-terminal domain-containing protein [Parasutterella sp.]
MRFSKKEGADYLLTSKLDDIAWIFNLRGSDVPDNPVFYAYSLIPAKGNATLFINEEKSSCRSERTIG